MTAAPRPTEISESPSSGDPELQNVRLIAVPPDSVRRVAPLVAPFLKGVAECSHGTNDLESIFALSEKGESQLWIATRDGDPIGAFATVIESYPLAKCCVVWAAGGDFRPMVAGTVEALEEYARAEGCSQILVQGPEFIRKMLQDYGELVRVIIKREV